MLIQLIAKSLSPCRVRIESQGDYEVGNAYYQPNSGEIETQMAKFQITNKDIKTFESGFITVQDVKFYCIEDHIIGIGDVIIMDDKEFTILHIADYFREKHYRIYFSRERTANGIQNN